MVRVGGRYKDEKNKSLAWCLVLYRREGGWVVGLEFSKIITKDKRPKRLAWFLVLCRREGGGRGGVGGLRPLEAMLPQSSDDGRQETIGKKISNWLCS